MTITTHYPEIPEVLRSTVPAPAAVTTRVGRASDKAAAPAAANVLEAGYPEIPEVLRSTVPAPAAVTTRVGLASDRDAARAAADVLKTGQAVAQFFRGVGVVWIDGMNTDAVDHIHRIKGEKRVGRPLSSVISAQRLLSMVDLNRVHPTFRALLSDPRDLVERFGDLGLLRLPIRREVAANLAPVLVSRDADGEPVFQNWLPYNPADIPILAAMDEAGLAYPAPTSMNVSGEPEIVEQLDAAAFSVAYDIPMFLLDTTVKGRVKGSFPIITIDLRGATLARVGHFNPRLLSYLLGGDVNMDEARPEKYPIIPELASLEPGTMSPAELRRHLLNVMWD